MQLHLAVFIASLCALCKKKWSLKWLGKHLLHVQKLWQKFVFLHIIVCLLKYITVLGNLRMETRQDLCYLYYCAIN